MSTVFIQENMGEKITVKSQTPSNTQNGFKNRSGYIVFRVKYELLRPNKGTYSQGASFRLRDIQTPDASSLGRVEPFEKTKEG